MVSDDYNKSSCLVYYKENVKKGLENTDYLIKMPFIFDSVMFKRW